MFNAKLMVIACLVSCAAHGLAAEERVTFKEVTAEVIDVNPPIVGNAFDHVFLDINDDNLLDILINNHNTHDQPIWLGTADHKFKFWKNLPNENTSHSGFWMGEVDHNGDGKTDIVWTGNEGGVLINLNQSEQGSMDPVFKSVPVKHSSPYTAFADLDGDGSLETLLRVNNLFKDVTKPPTKDIALNNNFRISDFNNDGWPDLFNPGDQGKREYRNGPRKIYKNNKGVLEDITDGMDLFSKQMGGYICSADFNNDGNMDIYIFGSYDNKDLVPEAERKGYKMKLYFGDGKFGFTDVTESAGVAQANDKGGYSHVYIADLDNDSYVDIINQGNYGTHVWMNNGNGTFTKSAKKKKWISGKHMRLDDYDMDGRLDIVTGGPGASYRNRETSISVFRNTTENDNKWLKLQVRQDDKNTMAIGAMVRVYKAGTKEIVGCKMVSADTAAGHPRLHFGLASVAQVDIEVTFPSGQKKVIYKGVDAGRYIVLRSDGSVKDVVFGQQK